MISLKDKHAQEIEAMKIKLEPLERFKEAKIKEERDKGKKEKKALKKEKQKASKVDSVVNVLKDAHGEEDENDNRVVVVSNISTSHRYDALSKSCDGDSAILENVRSKLGQSDDDPPIIHSLKPVSTFTANPVVIDGIVHCEYCEESFSYQHTVSWVIHEHDHVSAGDRKKHV